MKYDHEVKERKDTRPRQAARMPAVDSSLWNLMETYLEGRGLDCPTAKKNGWYPSSCAGDEYMRVVIPATNLKGLAYWQARAMIKGDEPRYQSPSVSRGDSIIQVYPLYKDWMPFLIVCEGPMDALAAASSGMRAVALMGTSPTDETLDMLMAVAADTEHISYFTDRDALSEAMQLTQRLMKRGLSMTISNPSPYKDLAAIPKKKRDDLLKTYVQHCLK